MFDIPAVQQAGTNLEFQLQISNDDVTMFDPFSRMYVRFALQSEVEGATSFYSLFDVRMDDGDIMLVGNSVIPISAYAYGKYNIDAVFVVREPMYGNIHTVGLNVNSINVDNTPDRVDVTPPSINNIYAVGESVSPGQSFNIIFTATDENLICTGDLAQRGECHYPSPWHLVFEGPASIIDFPEVVLVEDDLYFVTVKVPEDALPGEYQLTAFEVQDIAGNGVSFLPEGEGVLIEILSSE